MKVSSKPQSTPLSIKGASSLHTVVVFDNLSPEKASQDWILSLNLTKDDKAVLETPGWWLNNSMISAAHTLLERLSENKISGFQNPQLGKKLAFAPVPPYQKFIQILHVDGNHWLLISNIRPMDNDVLVGSVSVAFTLLSVSIQRSKFAALLNHNKPCSILTP